MKKTFKKQNMLASLLCRQRGTSLLESLAYLGIAALVILGAVSMLSNASSSSMTNRAVEQLVSLRTSVRKLYMGQAGGYGAAAGTNLESIVIAAKAYPTTLTVTSGTLYNTWGGSVDVQGYPTGFTITYNNVPKAECVSIISGADGWTSIVQGTETAITTFPATPTAAQGACTSATANTIAFSAS